MLYTSELTGKSYKTAKKCLEEDKKFKAKKLEEERKAAEAKAKAEAEKAKAEAEKATRKAEIETALKEVGEKINAYIKDYKDADFSVAGEGFKLGCVAVADMFDLLDIFGL